MTSESPGAGERRHPLRFVWQMDEDHRFTLVSDEFIALIGPRTATALGRPWPELATELGLDPDARVAQAIATRNTWSGLHVAWPVDDGGERLSVEMSGLPVFDRERAFRGYRGFGVCRDLVRLSALARTHPRAPDTAASPPAEVPSTFITQPSAITQPPAAAAPPTENVVTFPAPEPAAPALSPLEHHAFRELSRRLAQRLNNGSEDTGELGDDGAHLDETDALVASAHDVRTMFDRLPLGVLIYRLDQLIYANPAFLQAVGHRSLEELAGAGGLDSLLVTPARENVEEASGQPLALTIERGERGKLDAELIRIDWEGEMAHALVTKAAVAQPEAASTNGAPANAELAELRSILDTATDGVVMLDRAGKVLSANRSAEALFGYEAHAFAGFSLFDLLAPESHDVASAYLDSLRDDGVASMLNSGREVMGRVRQGGLLPLFMTVGQAGDSKKLCAVFRDLTQWKKTEEDLVAARRQAEKSSSAKSDFLAKISHEIRTPLNAIIGFSEVMMEERFGPVGNERYRGYLKDIHASGGHLLSLINDLLDLSKIEAGKLELTFANVSLNDLTQQCVAIMQPQANRERVIIRTALSPKLPQVMADARSVRQIVLNLIANSIKFTGAGGQVIVSTALKDDGEVALRVRDTGIGMSEKDVETALEPFRQVATSGRVGGTGLGLPLTKALAEANQARFAIKSAPKEGTLVEVAFPVGQVLVG
jgi:PAS domain S-box-containing protein